MVSKLCSSRMLSGCRRASSLRHCCVVVCISCHWHKYDLVLACAPHLSFLRVVLSFIILCIAWPSAGGLFVIYLWDLLVVLVGRFLGACMIVVVEIVFGLVVAPLG